MWDERRRRRRRVVEREKEIANSVFWAGSKCQATDINKKDRK